MEKKYTYIRGDYQRLLIPAGKATITVEFKGGNSFKGVLPSLSTSSALVQQAIEGHHRFGKEIRLVSIDGLDPKEWEKRNSVGTKSADSESQNAGKKKPGKKQVKSVKSFNDAVDYFANLGASMESEEELGALCDEFKVEFPNLQ